jgi:DNA-binding XRE family transcriptional regulator
MDIRSQRKANGLTQVQLAQLVGASQTSISDWEAGKATPSSKHFPLLAAAFKCTIDDVYNYQAKDGDST